MLQSALRISLSAPLGARAVHVASAAIGTSSDRWRAPYLMSRSRFSLRFLSSVKPQLGKGKVGEPWALKDSFGNVKKTQQFYDAYAQDYQTTILHQGYNCPQTSVALLDEALQAMESGSQAQRSTLRVLDSGSGCGMVGAELIKIGFSQPQNMVAHDLSEKMLELAKQRNVYGHFVQHDMMAAPFDFADGSFDVITCIGVTSYLEPTVLSEFLRLLAPSGLLVITYKRSVKGKFIARQQALAQSGALQQVAHLPEQRYLPNNPDPHVAAETVDFFVLRKT